MTLSLTFELASYGRDLYKYKTSRSSVSWFKRLGTDGQAGAGRHVHDRCSTLPANARQLRAEKLKKRYFFRSVYFSFVCVIFLSCRLSLGARAAPPEGRNPRFTGSPYSNASVPIPFGAQPG